MTANYAEALERQAELAQFFGVNLAKNSANVEQVLRDLGSGDLTKLESWVQRFPGVGMSASEVASVGRLSADDWRESLYGALHALQCGATFACTPEIGSWLET